LNGTSDSLPYGANYLLVDANDTLGAIIVEKKTLKFSHLKYKVKSPKMNE